MQRVTRASNFAVNVSPVWDSIISIIALENLMLRMLLLLAINSFSFPLCVIYRLLDIFSIKIVVIPVRIASGTAYLAVSSAHSIQKLLLGLLVIIGCIIWISIIIGTMAVRIIVPHFPITQAVLRYSNACCIYIPSPFTCCHRP